MAPAKDGPTSRCHVVAMPYPGRGHINPMLNLCKLLLSRRADILVTFVVTEEWLGFLGSESKPANFRFATVPNVIPSEVGRAADFPNFLKATLTKLEEPFERLLDRLGEAEPLPSVIIFDTYLSWVVGVGNRRNIPVASFWTMSAWVFSVFHHFHLLQQNGHFPADVAERGKEEVNYIPGISSTRIADLPTVYYGDGLKVIKLALEAVSSVSKAQFLLFTSIYEIETEIIDALKPTCPITTYHIGPAIPYFTLEEDDRCHVNMQPEIDKKNYMHWLDSQPNSSVLYISQGSFLSVSASQMDEIIAGVRNSGIRYFWVARGEASQLKERCGENGMVVPWCDQLKVLCHRAVGGFWSHCGWNSTKECLFAGLPMLTFPIFWDQPPNSKRVVEDWRIGLRVRREIGDDGVVERDEISGLLQRFMNLESKEGKEMRERSRKLKDVCRQAVAKGGSADASIDAFIDDICKHL